MLAESPRSFEDKRKDYFYKLGLEVRPALKLHKKQGLWNRVEKETEAGTIMVRDWGNVTEHCLVEAARASVLADLLHLSPDLTYDLIQAAALHDFFKKGEKRIATEGEFSWDSYTRASEEADKEMRAAGVSERQIALVNSVGSGSLPETQRILDKPEKTDFDLAFLAMHYIDDYTFESDWTNPNEVINGKIINDLDRRMDRNEAHPRYQRLNLEGRKHLGGETAFEAQRRLGHEIEELLTQVINQRNWNALDPNRLHEYVDGVIFTEIETL